MITCKTCSQEKPLTEFGPDNNYLDGYSRRCNTCTEQARMESKVKDRIRKAKWAKDNKERLAIKSHNYYLTHKDEWQARDDALRQLDPVAYKRMRRDQDMRSKYGISADEYDIMFSNQGNCCAICGLTMNDRQMVVDHDHDTGYIRGIVCSDCNFALGHFYDNTQTMINAISYLNKYSNAL